MKLLIALMILCGSCSSTTTYKPSVYGHDYIYGEIVTPITYKRISCTAKEFNEYVSFTLVDLSKLVLILKEAKLPYSVRLILEKADKELSLIKNKQLRR